jgi:hypothetical protein
LIVVSGLVTLVAGRLLADMAFEPWLGRLLLSDLV